mmetsp:Transcript_25073/g.71594  ORF Transcript_25073/g.71594 Transcript_25073/m.71594 type:complete len:320 (-) Transcript_25073:1598-2557(-)
MGSDTESAGGDLLDRRASVVQKSCWVFTTLSGIRACTHSVHGNSESFVCLSTDRSKRHCTSGKTLDDFTDRLDFLQWNGSGRIKFELELSTEGDLLVLLIGESSEFLVRLSRVRTSSDLEGCHVLRSVQVRLSTIAVVELSIASDHDLILGGMLGECIIVEALQIPVETIKVRSLDTGSGTGEATIDNFIGQTDCLEDLGSLITLECRNTHLAHDLQNTLCGCLAVVVHAFVVGELLLGLGLDHSLGIHLADSLVGHVWADTVATIAKDGRKIVHFLAVSNLGKKSRLGSLFGSDQMMVDSSDSNKRRQSNTIRSSELV